MNDSTSGKDAEHTKAEHGARSEVNWEAGEGRQPYQNQQGGGAPAAAHETAEGDRGDASGRNLEQLEDVKRKP